MIRCPSQATAVSVVAMPIRAGSSAPPADALTGGRDAVAQN